MNHPSPLAKAIEHAIREIAASRKISLQEAAEVWKSEIHRRAEAIRQRQGYDRN
jgi:hypothetical protein